MSARLRTIVACDKSVADNRPGVFADKLPPPRKTCPCCGQSVNEHVTSEDRRRAAAEWDAMDERGQLPEGWEWEG